MDRMDREALTRRHDSELQLVVYREMHAHRGDMIRRALAAGLSKYRISELSGIARTTIDRLLREGD